MSLSGDLGFGYNGNYGNVEGSSHGTGLNGDAVRKGITTTPSS